MNDAPLLHPVPSNPFVPVRDLVATQGSLALDTAVVVSPPRTPELERRSTRVEHITDLEVRTWAARFAQAVVESVAGHRPVAQLVRWTSASVYRDVERRVRLTAQAAPQRSRAVHPQVRTVHLCRPDDGIVEASVIVRHGARTRALALRLERRRQRWVCTVLELV